MQSKSNQMTVTGILEFLCLILWESTSNIIQIETKIIKNFLFKIKYKQYLSKIDRTMYDEQIRC